MRLRAPLPRAFSTLIQHDAFTVPCLPGVSFNATYRVFGKVTEDASGDWTTPDGAPEVAEVESELVECFVQFQEPVSGDWREASEVERDWIVRNFETEIAAAFMEAVGGTEAAQERAVEECVSG
jgi:hypothetical protein